MTTHRDPWPAGSPAWADITVPSLAVARDFYGPLFGWTFVVGGPETGGYTQAFLDGRRVVGLTEPTAPSSTPAWCVYLATDDLLATAAAVLDHGGHVVLGTTGLYADPTGAVFGLWQSGTHTGWDVEVEPGSVTWTEVMVHDQPRALSFYRDVFGYHVDDLSAPGFTYASLSLGSGPLAGVGQYSPSAGSSAPPAWTLYFAVSSADEAADSISTLGGTVVSPPTDTPFGRMAIAAGPFGEVFAVMGPRLAT
jgi:predicted enzyme related to lactoylglutathione lyase